jgi:dTMP kinase
MAKGFFIAFEGIDGSGKTEQVFRLAQWLFSTSKKFTSIVCTREPTWGTYGRRLRRFLHSEKDPYAGAERFLKLYVADRKEHCAKEIVPALKAGKLVLCDRFMHSSYAFQQTQGIALKRIVQMHAGVARPDLVLLIDLPAKEAFGRLSKRNVKGNEKFERLEFMARLRSLYLRLPKQFPKDRIVVINGRGSREQVAVRVKAAVIKSGVAAGVL